MQPQSPKDSLYADMIGCLVVLWARDYLLRLHTSKCAPTAKAGMSGCILFAERIPPRMQLVGGMAAAVQSQLPSLVYQPQDPLVRSTYSVRPGLSPV
jgi:hypothetical protein